MNARASWHNRRSSSKQRIDLTLINRRRIATGFFVCRNGVALGVGSVTKTTPQKLNSKRNHKQSQQHAIGSQGIYECTVPTFAFSRAEPKNGRQLKKKHSQIQNKHKIHDQSQNVTRIIVVVLLCVFVHVFGLVFGAVLEWASTNSSLYKRNDQW